MSLISPAKRGHAPWLERVSRWRARVDQATAGRPELPLSQVKRSARDSAALTAAGVPSEIASAHEASLTDSIGDAAGIAFVAQKLGAAGTRPYTDALKRFYKALGEHLDLAEESSRPELAKRTIAALRCLLEENASSSNIVPMVRSVAALLDASVRRAAELDARDPSRTGIGEMAAATIAEIIERFEAAPGLGSVLAVHPNLTEQLDLVRKPKTFLEQAQTWSSVTNMLATASPREGFSQSIGSELAELLARAIAQGDADPLASACTMALAPTAPMRESLLSRLRSDGTPLSAALMQLIEASPSGPESLFRAIRSIADTGDQTLARWILPLAGSPAAASAIEQLLRLRPDREPTSDLAASFLALYGLSAEGLKNTRDPWRLFIALSAGPHRDESLVSALASEVREPKGERTFPALEAFTARYLAAKTAVESHRELGPDRERSIEPLAHLGVEDPEPVLEALARIKSILRSVDGTALLGSDDSGRPGLEALLDPNHVHRSPPLPYLFDLLEAARTDVAPAGPARASQTEAARIAMSLADCVGSISVNPERQMDRIRADWRLALAHPEKLLRTDSTPSRTLLAAGNFSISKFQKDHPKLPPELALTAAVHLSASQLAWVEQRLEHVGQSRTGARACRDFVFGLVEAKRTDLIDAFARSTSSAKAISAAIEEVAVAFRRGELGAAPFDLIARGLEAGRDPIADLEAGRKTGMLEGVDLIELTKGRVTEEGAKNIARVSKQLNLYLALYKSGGSNIDGFDQAFLRPLLLRAIASEAEGTWPDLKYKGSANQALLSMMTAWEQEYWKRRSITLAAEGSTDSVDLSAALGTLQKIGRAMTEAIDLGAGPDGAFRWDAETLRTANLLREELIADFRELDKNDADRPRIARNLTVLRDVIALLELHDGLSSESTDPETSLLGLLPLLERALPALTELGGPAFAEAGQAVLDATKGLGASPLSGKHAIDDDSFLGLVEAPSSGCFGMHWTANGRHWAMASILLDANIRVLRVMDGGEQRYRSYFKVFQGRLEGYEGPILWLDVPQPDGGGTDEDLDLLYRHAIKKALALGYPVMTGANNFDRMGNVPVVDARSSRIGAVGQSMGLNVREMAPVTVRVHPGNVGILHSDTMFLPTDSHHGIAQVDRDRGDAAFIERAVTARSVVFPPSTRRSA